MPDNDNLDQFSDVEIVARTLYGEARGEGYEGQQAVCSVIFNRANKPSWWGISPRTVALHPYQFSCWNADDPNRAVIVTIADSNTLYAQCLEIANLAFNKNLPDNTNGADSYVVTGTPANWIGDLVPVAVVGRQSFYKTT